MPTGVEPARPEGTGFRDRRVYHSTTAPCVLEGQGTAAPKYPAAPLGVLELRHGIERRPHNPMALSSPRARIGWRSGRGP